MNLRTSLIKVGSALSCAGMILAFQNCSKTSTAAAGEFSETSVSSKALVEGTPVVIEGEVSSMYEDYADGTHKIRHYITDKSGKRYELKSSRQDPYYGGKVKIKGRALNKSSTSSEEVVEVQQEEPMVFAYNGLATDNPFPMPASSNAYSVGEQKTLLILVNFQDLFTQPISVEQGRAWMAQLDQFVREGSKNKAWVVSDVVGWFTISLSATVCDTSTLGNRARDMAKVNGYDPALYDRVVFAFPKNGCGYKGSGSVGGKQTQAFINNDFTTGTLFHEFGHNLGLDHARFNECGADPLGLNCYAITYGDSLNVMGSSESLTGPYSPHDRLVLGWAASSDVIEVTANGVYNIIPYADNVQSGAKILRIPKPGDPNNWFYVNMHQIIGMDEVMLTQTGLSAANLTNGVVIREASQYVSFLLDMTPGTGGSVSDQYDPALTVGNSFQDPFSGIKITTESVSSAGASVRVEFTNQRSCRRRTPYMRLPGTFEVAGPVNVTTPVAMTVVSPSSQDCVDESISVAAVNVPAGWVVDPGAAIVTTGGREIPWTVNVTPPTGAVSSYINLTVSNQAGTSAQDDFRFAVSTGPAPTPVNRAPVAVNDSVTILTKAAVTVQVLGNDSDPEGSALRVTAVGRPSAGSVKINADNTVTYTPAGKFKTSDSFSYTISDGSLTATATVTITLSSATGTSTRK